MTDPSHRYPLDERDPRVVQLYGSWLASLPYEPNKGQIEAFAAFCHFLYVGGERSVMLLNGYAGTGKTSLVGALVKALALCGVKVVLLAPTGRAAHVFADYAGRGAFTIHRKIFRQDSYLSDGFALAENKHTDTVFIVDEASMISNGAGDVVSFGSGRLLDDLVSYVYSGRGCKLLLMGDNAQLPPVGQAESPAMEEKRLEGYGLQVYSVSLTHIARQEADSGILHNATLLRDAMREGIVAPPQIHIEPFDDIEAVSGEFLLESLSDSYDAGEQATIIITRSNRRAMLFNLGVRNQVLYREEELVPGDWLLVAKNNYYWSSEVKELDFIANGDVARVVRVWGDTERVYGLRFADVTLEFPDHDNLELDVKIVLDSLLSETPALTREQSERLYNEVMEECTGDKRSRYRQMKQHPYFNALQVKYAYAVTCHKAQGGQWENVYIDMGAIARDAMLTLDFFRWIYTALTRATRHVYLINWRAADTE